MALELIHVMEVVTIGVTLLMFATGIVPCSHMYKTGDTRNVPFHMFLLSTISCSGMLHYGLMKNLTSIAWLNGFGAFLNCSYVLIYLAVAPQKSKAFVYLTAGVLYMLSLYYYLYNVVVTQPEVGDNLGMMTSNLTTLIMCLPLFELINNVRNKNADGMPVVMLVGGILCSSCWLVFGLMLNDANIYKPNIPGILLACAKLYVIRLYGTSEKQKTS